MSSSPASSCCHISISSSLFLLSFSCAFFIFPLLHLLLYLFLCVLPLRFIGNFNYSLITYYLQCQLELGNLVYFQGPQLRLLSLDCLFRCRGFFSILDTSAWPFWGVHVSKYLGVTSPLCCLQLPRVRNPSLTSGLRWIKLPVWGLKRGPCLPRGLTAWQGCSDCACVACRGVCPCSQIVRSHLNRDLIGRWDFLSLCVFWLSCATVNPFVLQHQVEGRSVRPRREQLTLPESRV